MAGINVNPTRMELKKLRGRLSTAQRGHKLLKDKCDELMKQFLDIVRENMALRQKVEKALAGVHSSFSVAAAVSSPKQLEEALMIPKKQGELSVDYRNMMSVNVPVFSYSETSEDEESSSSLMTDTLNYGFAFTSAELDSAVSELTAVLPDLIRLAQIEKTAQMLASEIEKTRRRVNALEYIMIPQYQETIKRITMKLDENERGNTTRLMKVKSMIAEKSLSEKHSREEANL